MVNRIQYIAKRTACTVNQAKPSPFFLPNLNKCGSLVII